jgi:hypothetical protein
MSLIGNRSGIAGSMIHLTYGLPIKRVNDPWIAIAEAGMHVFTSAAVPGKYAVDVLPILKYLPDWFPGAQFQREAKEWKEIFTRFIEAPFKAAKQGMVSTIYFSDFLRTKG